MLIFKGSRGKISFTTKVYSNSKLACFGVEIETEKETN